MQPVAVGLILPSDYVLRSLARGNENCLSVIALVVLNVPAFAAPPPASEQAGRGCCRPFRFGKTPGKLATAAKMATLVRE
jgi:hypothetical protein